MDIESVEEEDRSFPELLNQLSDRAMDAFLRSGVPSSAAQELVSYGVDAVHLGILKVQSGSTFNSVRKRFTLAEGDRLYRAGKIALLAADVFGDRGKAKRWLNCSLHTLDGLTPLEATVTTPGYLSVEELLMQLQAGFHA